MENAELTILDDSKRIPSGFIYLRSIKTNMRRLYWE